MRTAKHLNRATHWLVSWRWVRLPGNRGKTRQWTIFPILAEYASRKRFMAWCFGTYSQAEKHMEDFQLKCKYPLDAEVDNPEAWY